MLIKANKSKKLQKEAKKALPEQVMNFIGEEVRKQQPDSIIDEAALDSILGQNLSKLDLAKKQISEEEIEAKAQELIQAKAQELLEAHEASLLEAAQQNKERLEQMQAEAQAQANQILDQANQHVLAEAQKLDAHKAEFENQKQQHFQEIQKLQQQAYIEALEEAKPFVIEVVELFKNLHQDKKEMAQMIKDHVADIAFDVAKQVLNYEVKNNENILEQQVLNAVNRLLDTKGIMKIYINPEDKPKVAILNELLLNVLDKSIRLVFLNDEQVNTGSCMIETSGGKLDASFSTQLATIKATFEQYLGHKIDVLPELAIEENEMVHNNETELNLSAEHLAGLKPDGSEPSDLELAELEENFEDIADLDIDADLDSLLNDIGNEDDAMALTIEEKPKQEPAAINDLEDMSLVDNNDGTELGANDFSAEDENYEDLSETKEEEYEDEDGNKFVEYDEFASDENFGDSGEMMDDRFPEY